MTRNSLCVSVLLLLSACAGFGATETLSGNGIEWVRIEGGVFQMGDNFEASNDDALPVHRVVVEPFYISRYETTFEQFDSFARSTDQPIPVADESQRGARAVVQVSWDDAMSFCTYAGGRLPSEIEWEYAAAGGEAKQKYAGTNDDVAIDEYAHHRENSGGMSMPVGLKKANLFGLYDMSGNAGEWVSNYYEKYPEPGDAAVYFNPAERDMRLVRGGSVSSEAHVTRTYWRAGTLRNQRTPSIGFRCATDAS